MKKRKTLFNEYVEWYDGKETRYLRNWVELTSIVVGVPVAVCISILSIVFLVNQIDNYDCNKFEVNTGIETKHKNFTCYANYKGEWVEKQNIILTIEGGK
jgi:hypothetical protein